MDLAAEQHGVFTLGQLAEHGLEERGAQLRVEAGRLHRVFPGVYALSRVLTVDGRRMAAVLSVGPRAYLSHRTAAVAYRTLSGDGLRWSVTVDHGRGGVTGPAEVHVRRSRRLPAADVTTLRGIPITTVARTLVDIAGEQGGRLVERVVHETEVAGLLDVAAVLACIERNPGRRGRAVLQRALGVGETPPDDFTALFARLCSRYAVGRPRFGVHLDGGDRLYECDVVFDEARVIVELDGEQVHRTRRNFHQDRRRDAALAARGWLVIRLTWQRLKDEPARVAEELRAILALRTAGVGPDAEL